MCGLPDNLGVECFPKCFQELFYKYLNEMERAQKIVEAIDCRWMFEELAVPFYPALRTTISKRDWMSSYLGKQVDLVNVVKEIPPFEMIDLSEKYIAVTKNHYEDLHCATAASSTYARTIRKNVTTQTPASS